MKLRGTCGACGKLKFFIRRRAYVVPQVSLKPIISKDELCGKCFRGIKHIIGIK